jgi:hypothetical protein
VGKGTRNPDIQIHSGKAGKRNPLNDNRSGEGPERFSPGFAPAGSDVAPDRTAPPADADVARIVGAWPTLPAPIKAAILALISAAPAAGRTGAAGQ